MAKLHDEEPNAFVIFMAVLWVLAVINVINQAMHSQGMELFR